MEKVTYVWKIKLLDLEPSTMIHADSVSFLTSIGDRIHKLIRRCLAFPGQIRGWILNSI